MRVEGRAWVFGDDISTDLLYPQVAYSLPIAEAAQLVFSAIRPGWADLVEPGDLVVGGENFGTGSSRPAVALLKRGSVECGGTTLLVLDPRTARTRVVAIHAHGYSSSRRLPTLVSQQRPGANAPISFLENVVRERRVRGVDGLPSVPASAGRALRRA